MKKKINKKDMVAVILAAGSSSRMGFPKPLLEINGKNFVQILKEKLISSGLNNIYLILGASADKISQNLNREGLNIIINNSWNDGQLSSLKKAIKNLPAGTGGIMMCLIDHPQVKRYTIKKLLLRYLDSEADIVIPEYGGRGGHPVIFDKNIFKDLLAAPLEEGARAVVRDKKNKVIRVKVNDRYIRQDIDTEEEFKKVERKEPDI